MFRPHARRLGTIAAVVLALLFSQLALASYACPGAAAGGQSAMAAMQMQPGEPCNAADTPADQDQPLLCHQHCVNAPQSFDPVHTPTLSLPGIVQMLVVPLPLNGQAGERACAMVGQARPPPDPIFLSTLRLRV